MTTLAAHYEPMENLSTRKHGGDCPSDTGQAALCKKYLRYSPTMLVTLIGSPCSGKTTCAARMFAALKDAGVPAEFLPEQARLYIAERRAVVEGGIRLSNVDQVLIMKKQLEVEVTMMMACGKEVVLVSDGSPINSLLYMDPEFRKSPMVKAMVDIHRQHQSLTFYVNTVSPGFGADPNRIHDMEFSRTVDRELPELLRQEVPWLSYIHLQGDSQHRTDVALGYVFTQLLKPS